MTEPEGPHYTYVASEVLVPTNNSQAREYGLDLNGDKTVDNQLGMVLGTLAGQGFNVQDTIDEAVAEGSIILLADFQTTSFESTTGAGLQIKLGDKATAMPAPCTDPADPLTCGKHLTGTGVFTVAAGSPQNAAVTGKIIGGTFTGGPGDISLQIALGGTAGIQLDLIGARAKATGLSENGMESIIIGGALSKNDLDTKVIPAIHAQIAPIIAADCTNMTPPDCGCMAGSTGKTVLNLFDSMPKDCTVTVDEIKNNTLIQSLLAPDVTINGVMALSLGLKAKAVKGTFPTAQ
ncbi:MAG: hypothetical protein M3680_12990 [Myxococcota bacterium]|nr:hypothetical protein [Myxococcota bacterium]